MWSWAKEAPQNFGFSYNIFANGWASDFKFGAQLGFAEPRHKITRRKKGGRGTGLGKLPKMWGSPSIFTVADASDFKFGAQLGFAKAHHKTTPIGKWAWPWATGAPQNFVVPLQYLHNG